MAVRPTRVEVNRAPTMYEDSNVVFNDLSEQLMVTTLEKKRTFVWRYAQRDWTFSPGDKAKPIKLEVCIKYLGDPRSAIGLQNVYRIPGERQAGSVPERWKELRRLSILYGAYEGLMEKLPTLKFRDIPRDHQFPDRDLFPGMGADWFVVPRVLVQNLDGVEIKFPVYFPEAYPYRYDSEALGEMSDVRSELERTRRVMAQLADRLESLESMEESGELEIPGAAEDSARPPAG